MLAAHDLCKIAKDLQGPRVTQRQHNVHTKQTAAYILALTVGAVCKIHQVQELTEGATATHEVADAEVQSGAGGPQLGRGHLPHQHCCWSPPRLTQSKAYEQGCKGLLVLWCQQAEGYEGRCCNAGTWHNTSGRYS